MFSEARALMSTSPRTFTLPYLDVGTYVVYVQASGFSTLASTPFTFRFRFK